MLLRLTTRRHHCDRRYDHSTSELGFLQLRKFSV